MNTFVIKIKSSSDSEPRYFNDFINNRIRTSWSLAAAKLFSSHSKDLKKIEDILIEKKIKFTKIYIQEVEKEEVEEETFIIQPLESPKDDKKRETIIMQFSLPEITTKPLIEYLCFIGYQLTNRKFQISFLGSKGYLSSFTINCEGIQKENNRIFVENLYNKNKTFKSIQINVFHSMEFGIRLSTGNDQPRILDEIKL